MIASILLLMQRLTSILFLILRFRNAEMHATENDYHSIKNELIWHAGSARNHANQLNVFDD